MNLVFFVKQQTISTQEKLKFDQLITQFLNSNEYLIVNDSLPKLKGIALQKEFCMRVAFTILMFVLILPLSAMPIGEEQDFTQVSAQQQRVSNVYSNGTHHQSVARSSFANSHAKTPARSERKSQISKVQQEFTNVSVIEIGKGFSPLTRYVYPQIKNCHYRGTAYANQGAIFNILFQVIISPNAP